MLYSLLISFIATRVGPIPPRWMANRWPNELLLLLNTYSHKFVSEVSNSDFLIHCSFSNSQDVCNQDLRPWPINRPL